MQKFPDFILFYFFLYCRTLPVPFEISKGDNLIANFFQIIKTIYCPKYN